MQTTHSNPSHTQTASPHGGSFSNIKSFSDLNGKLIEKEIDAFAEQVRKGIGCWREAGHILVELSKRQPDIFRLIQARYPEISESTLQTFARIGRKEVWPPLLVDSSLGARKLLECPYDLQKEYSEKPIKLAVAWKNGELKTVEKKVADLSRAEVAVVFKADGGGINTLEQQAWRLRNDGKIPTKPAAVSTEYPPSRLVNVDVGYVKLTLKADGNYVTEACGKSAMAQPVRLVPNENGDMIAVVVLYRREYK